MSDHTLRLVLTNFIHLSPLKIDANIQWRYFGISPYMSQKVFVQHILSLFFFKVWKKITGVLWEWKMYNVTPYAQKIDFIIIFTLFSQNNLQVQEFNIFSYKTRTDIFELLIYVDEGNVVRMHSKYYKDPVIILVSIHPYTDI